MAGHPQNIITNHRHNRLSKLYTHQSESGSQASPSYPFHWPSYHTQPEKLHSFSPLTF